MLILDLETRSRCDLKKRGAYNYAADPSTEILIIGYTNGEDTGWVTEYDKLPVAIRYYIENSDGLIGAWNAQFDRLVWDACAPVAAQVALRRWYCVAAQARINAMPSGLNNCYRALTGTQGKDVRGPTLIRALCVPQTDGSFRTDSALLGELGGYCLRDVAITAYIKSNTRLLTPAEHLDWVNTEVINDYGLGIDRAVANNAVTYAAAEALHMAQRLNVLTEGDVTRHTQVARVKDWLTPRLSAESISICSTTDKNGVKRFSLDKHIREQLLAQTIMVASERSVNEDLVAREVVELIDAGNKSSVAKFQNMLDRSSKQGRVHGAYVYAGASQTTRFSSTGLQVHNFTRDCLSPEEALIVADKMAARKHIPDTMGTLSKMLRPTIVPDKGNVFVVGDWSSIEACALPWLAKDEGAAERIAILADPARDIYIETQRELSLESRQLGKVVELSMGYGGGTGACMAMARAYSVVLDERLVAETIVKPWRATNPWAEIFWNGLESAAKKAIFNPGDSYSAGLVSYAYYPGLIDGTLVCTLPGGLSFQYPRARVESNETQWGTRTVITALKANWLPPAKQKEWPRVGLWRGLLAENATQAFCASILRYTVGKALDIMDVIGHVHDEIIVETPVKYAEETRVGLQKLMMENPPWAKGMPLRAEPVIMTRYGK
jgi:DNA polymerase